MTRTPIDHWTDEVAEWTLYEFEGHLNLSMKDALGERTWPLGRGSHAAMVALAKRLKERALATDEERDEAAIGHCATCGGPISHGSFFHKDGDLYWHIGCSVVCFECGEAIDRPDTDPRVAIVSGEYLCPSCAPHEDCAGDGCETCDWSGRAAEVGP